MCVVSYEPSQADVTVFEALGAMPASQFTHAVRWYRHINSFGADMKRYLMTKQVISTQIALLVLLSSCQLFRPRCKDCIRRSLLLQMAKCGWSTCVSVCLLVTFVCPVKMAELTLDAIWGLTRVSPRNHVLDGGTGFQEERAIFGVVCPIEKHWESAAVYAKIAEPIKMPFQRRLMWVQGTMHYVGSKLDESIDRCKG